MGVPVSHNGLREQQSCGWRGYYAASVQDLIEAELRGRPSFLRAAE